MAPTTGTTMAEPRAPSAVSAASPLSAAKPVKRPHRFARMGGQLSALWSEFSQSKLALTGLVLFIAITALAVFAPWIAPQNPYDLAQLDLSDSQLPPLAHASMGAHIYWLGTDDQGRDMLSAILYGMRTSLYVSLVCTVLALGIGVALGLIGAFYGRKVDALIMRLADIQLSFPSILIALVFIAAFGKGVDKIIYALVLVQWAVYARTARGSALVELRKEYVEAARCLKLSDTRIIFRHVLPNCVPPLLVVATVQMATTISLEATLSFLGLGLPITEPSLGLLISNGYNYLLSGSYWISVFPGVALLLLMLCLNLMADRLRDVLNPRLKK
jgi:peptide/nickel transport system permease protein